jgi:hypothetical protein
MMRRITLRNALVLAAFVLLVGDSFLVSLIGWRWVWTLDAIAVALMIAAAIMDPFKGSRWGAASAGNGMEKKSR